MTINTKIKLSKQKKQELTEEEIKRAERMRIRNERKAKAKLSREQHKAWRMIKRDYGKD